MRLVQFLVGDSFVSVVLSFGYHVGWIIPIYLISLLLNGVWYDEIVSQCARLMTTQSGRTTDSASEGSWLTLQQRRISQEIYRILLYLMVMLQGVLLSQVLSMLPLFRSLATLCHFVSLASVYPLYCFEYKWSLRSNWTFKTRIRVFEYGFFYFVGFGTPFALSCFFLPYFASCALYGALFPLVTFFSSRFSFSLSVILEQNDKKTKKNSLR